MAVRVGILEKEVAPALEELLATYYAKSARVENIQYSHAHSKQRPVLLAPTDLCPPDDIPRKQR